MGPNAPGGDSKSLRHDTGRPPFSRVALNVDLFRRTRKQNVIGQTLAGLALVAISWPHLDVTTMVIFLLAHQLSIWTMMLTATRVLRDPRATTLPLPVIVTAVLPAIVLSSLMFLDRSAAESLEYALGIGIVLYATAAGAVVRRGPLRRLARATLVGLLAPYTVACLLAGHFTIGVATTLFLALVAGSGVGQVSKLYDELVDLRIAAALRATNAEADAHTDCLTGLVNRSGLQLIDGAAVDAVVAFFLDLDRFKNINDTYGHAAGDQVLRVVAERILACMRGGEVVARLGGDEFVVVISGKPGRPIEEIAHRLRAQLSRPIRIKDDVIIATASMGIVSHAGPRLNLDLLLAQSDEAMYQAKSEGSGGLMMVELDQASLITALEPA